MDDNLISKRKPSYPISAQLNKYLSEHERNIEIPVFYEDLLRFEGGVELFDENDEDTLWLRVYYSNFERDEINLSLKKVYSILHSDGAFTNLKNLIIDGIDFCTFGNSKPFRIKVKNILNDNYTYLHIKQADASRIYGLELEELLSPNNINFIVYKNTLIEEHITGISGDIYIKERLEKALKSSKNQIAKEFVKFNERCFVRLLGDMRSYNYVFVLTHDFDRIQFRLRAIDFDQQSYEGNLKIYKPQFFVENNKLVEMVSEILTKESIEEYVNEERSAIAKRATSEKDRLNDLLLCMENDHISTGQKITELKRSLFVLTKDINFKNSKNMGDLLRSSLDFVIRNYKNKHPLL